ncbi:GNAT family N-acetyltransferase [Shewanella indica]|jgi:ribosomal protein S18 acetylase RimI-like enzyme|uniref:GNAT family N-acetyltransferase n=1 Tax=Shewanella chilikensis TaxID=558541 RepID=A0A6G7LXD1_9GAMM|nr:MULTISPECIES: N-acetyltransferase [Shewanella]MBZ4677775.1 hypothetical protein [Shewanella sp.]MCA0950906.1 GNAT family N-acetyltransferase [Shewanella chilikensis]MCE9851966.1 GNAT family N-acetyltransferase [Shewanella chilikensis]QIJ06438.1 GNAT family N-acetyltransferase [Shewanella chilikensis]GHB19987.1 N-acetyltransferase GCN5 [Shewanella indica]
MQIRPISRADLDAVLALELATFGEHCYPDFFFRQALDAWSSGFLGSFVDGQLVGYLLRVSSEKPGQHWLLSLAVSPTKQGQGIGKHLLSACLDDCRHCVDELLLTVAPDNSARHLYSRMGFENLGLEADYFGVGEHRLLMRWQR